MNDFFAFLYEILAYFEGFSDDLFENNLYLPIGISMSAVSLVGTIIYYYVLNHPHLNRWYHWAGIVLIACIINFGTAYGVTFNSLNDIYAQKNQVIPYSADVVIFSLINVLWTIITSFAFSFMRKIGKWSYNCRNTPF
jgi:uncharacterized BrkB/YihY/UPF0761 family membrane protein